MQSKFAVKKVSSEVFSENFSDSLYHIFLIDARGKIVIDFAKYEFDGKTALFTSPYQNIQILPEEETQISQLDFHGDFYCIEYHKKEVACNGLLFNNIYLFPNVSLDDETYVEISGIFDKLTNSETDENFWDAVSRSYLQVILAISSREKSKILEEHQLGTKDFEELKTFQNLVDENFRKERTPAFYADLMHISPNALSKKIKKEFHKTPSQIIQERVILEAKKQIHLTRKSIKEIAAELNFEDEFYFSKYFKKATGVSPTKFRDDVGISVVADL